MRNPPVAVHRRQPPRSRPPDRGSRYPRRAHRTAAPGLGDRRWRRSTNQCWPGRAVSDTRLTFGGGRSRLAAVTIECTVGISPNPTVVRFADCEPESWANGAGVTRVIAKGWICRSSNDFDWRLSVADVTTSGSFSALPGVDRVITLADGPGLLLKVDDEEFALDPFRPLRFAGEARTQCQVVEPTRDFNVMTRRDVCSATVDVRVGSGILAAPLGAISYVVALKGQANVNFSDAECSDAGAVRRRDVDRRSGASGGQRWSSCRHPNPSAVHPFEAVCRIRALNSEPTASRLDNPASRAAVLTRNGLRLVQFVDRLDHSVRELVSGAVRRSD